MRSKAKLKLTEINTTKEIGLWLLSLENPKKVLFSPLKGEDIYL
jgi:hypothetical protein